MISEIKFLFFFLVPLLGFQVFLVWKVIHSLPGIVLAWQEDSGSSTNGLLNEGEQLKLLDSRFFGSGPYEALRRLGISSPLFGVAATAILILARPSSPDAAAADSLSDLKLLFSGVLGGALVAITNQICLWTANYKYQKRRNSSKLAPESNNLYQNVKEFIKRLDFAVTDAVSRSGSLITKLESESHKHSKGMLQNVEEFQKRLDLSVSDTVCRSGWLISKLERVFQEHNEGLLQNIEGMEDLHHTVMETVEGSWSHSETLSNSMTELTKSLNNVKEKFTALNETGLSDLSEKITAANTKIHTLSEKVGTLNENIESCNKSMEKTSELTKTSGESIGEAASSLKEAAKKMKNVSTNVATRWSNFSKHLDDTTRTFLTPKLKEIVENLEEQTEASKSAAENAKKAAEELAKTTEGAVIKIEDIRDVSSNVSTDINSGLTELNNSVSLVRGSIESSIKSQQGMLVDWKQVLDRLPVSFEKYADNTLKNMTADLSKMVAELSVLMKQVNEIVSHIDQK